jgi:hypothetical protein
MAHGTCGIPNPDDPTQECLAHIMYGRADGHIRPSGPLRWIAIILGLGHDPEWGLALRLRPLPIPLRRCVSPRDDIDGPKTRDDTGGPTTE